MFIKLHGAVGNRLIINVEAIKAVQEITKESKYWKTYGEAGVKSLLQIDDKLVPVKDSAIQIENRLKKLGQIGGTS